MTPPNDAGAERVRKLFEAEEDLTPEPPRPLARPLPPADPFPVDALGELLGSAAKAINGRVQAPLATCGQSVLAVATLATQAHCNVELPMGQPRPLSNFFMTSAATGERKSSVDNEALWPISRREAALREAYEVDEPSYQNDKIAWEKAREAAVKKAKNDRAQIKDVLDGMGPAPKPPLVPLLTCPEPTFEGLVKLFATGQPSLGIFAAEGGQFIGGHGMSDDAKLRTAAGMSAAWDGSPIKRVRSGDGATVLPGRRLCMHLMVQPDVASVWLGDGLLAEQGLLSRVLTSAPDGTSGTRMWREPIPEWDATLKRYGTRLLEILERPLPLLSGTRNQLDPRPLPFHPCGRRLWVAFYDHIERRLRRDGDLDSVRGLANKLPEHAGRMAAVLTLVRDIEATEVTGAEVEAGIALAEHYIVEALRLQGHAQTNPDIRLAQRLLYWLQHSWKEPNVSLPDIYQRSLNAIRDQATAKKLVTILEDHDWLVRLPDAAVVAGKRRREVWRIVRD